MSSFNVGWSAIPTAGRRSNRNTEAISILTVSAGFAAPAVEREARAALELLQAAAQRDGLTRELLERAIATLERARHARPATSTRRPG